MNHDKLLIQYEDTLSELRNDYRELPWWKLRARYKLSDEIERYEQLCLMTFLLSMMDKIEEKKEYTEINKIEDDFDAGYPT